MDSLKELIASKKQSFKDESQGKKYAKRSAIEENRLKRLREEEEQERQRKVRYSFFQRPLKLPKFDFPVRVIATPYANEVRLKTYSMFP